MRYPSYRLQRQPQKKSFAIKINIDISIPSDQEPVIVANTTTKDDPSPGLAEEESEYIRKTVDELEEAQDEEDEDEVDAGEDAAGVEVEDEEEDLIDGMLSLTNPEGTF